ncbi:ABC transporter substrate-binding protein [Chloroflexota bacterium]
MEKRGHKTIALLIITLVLLLAIVVNACGTDAEEEVEVRKVPIGMVTSMTGVIASTYMPLDQAKFDTIRWINDEGGILDGILIEVHWVDTAIQTHRAVVAYGKFVDAGAVTILMVSDNETYATLAKTQRDEIPQVKPGCHDRPMNTSPLQWVFSAGAKWDELFATSIKWALDNWTEERPMRVGFMGIESPSSFTPLDSAPKLAVEMGFDFVSQEILPFVGVIDASTELIRLSGKEIDFLYTNLYGAPAVATIKDMERLGLKGEWTVLQASGGLGQLVQVTGEDAAEGWHSSRFYPSVQELDLTQPGAATVLAQAREYRGWEQEEINDSYLSGYYAMDFVVLAITKAIEEVGLENLTGRADRDAMASMVYDGGGMLPAVQLSDAEPYFQKYVKIFRVQQGFERSISDWTEPYRIE